MAVPVAGALSRVHIAESLDRVRRYLRRSDLAGLVLARTSNVAWASAGINPVIDRTCDLDSLWLVVTPDEQHLVTNVVEGPRLLAEHPAELEVFNLHTVAWSPQSAFTSLAQRLIQADASRIGADVSLGFGADCAEAMTMLRMTHGPLARARLVALGEETAEALESALMAAEIGQTDLEVQARIAFEFEGRGITPIVLLVGGDDRVRRFRHPVAIGLPVRHLLMAVAVVRRHGLHVAVTRTMVFDSLSPAGKSRYSALATVQGEVLSAWRPNELYGDVYRALAHAYARVGDAKAWREHFQGGPIGYEQREFELYPGEPESPWAGVQVEVGQAVAFNPSFAGGYKVEDTFLLEPTGPVNITPALNWPTIEAPGVGPIAGVYEKDE